LEEGETTDQGHVTEARDGACLGFDSRGCAGGVSEVGASEVEVRYGGIETETESGGEVITEEDVGDGAIEKIRGGGLHFGAFELTGVIGDELGCYADEEAVVGFAFGITGAVDGAQVAGIKRGSVEERG